MKCPLFLNVPYKETQITYIGRFVEQNNNAEISQNSKSSHQNEESWEQFIDHVMYWRADIV